jgi:flagellar motility protein MotE (MotC chaperone)
MEKSRIDALAKLYEGMEETQVAPLINQFTDEQAVQILMSMKPASAAKILGVLSPQRAARISTKMITLTRE